MIGTGLALWLLITFAPMIAFFWVSWGEMHIHQIEEKVPTYLGGWARGVRSEPFMPESGRHLEYDLRTGWATSLDWKCQVSESDFLEFAYHSHWEIKDHVPEAYRYSWSQSYDRQVLPSSFYYVFVPAVSNGGLNVLYDRENGMMYGSYSSR